MHSAQRVTPRPLLFFLPFLLCQFLSVTLSSCGSTFQCEAITPPSAIPHLFIANGRVYLSSEGTGLRVLQESSGKQLWQASGQLAAIDGDQVYLDISQDTPSSLTALRADDGKQLWQKTVDPGSRVISAADGSVYLYQSTNAMLVALNGSDGTERWKNHLDRPTPMGDGDGISVQVSSSVVYVLSIGGQLSAYQEESDALLWSHLFPSPFAYNPDIPWQISNGLIYLTDTTHVSVLRASDGTLLWQKNASAFVLDQPRGVVLTLVSASSVFSLVALQARDGKVLWQRSPPQMQFSERGSSFGLKLIGDTVYAGRWASGNLPPGMRATYFVDDVNALRASDGTYLWQYHGKQSGDDLAVEGTDTTAYILSSSPVTTSAFLLKALRASDGQQLWQKTTPAAGLALANDALYTAYGGNDQTSGCTATGVAHIIKYRAADGQELWHVQP